MGIRKCVLALAMLCPLLVLADDGGADGARKVVTVELAVTGVLSSLATAASAWLIHRSRGAKQKRQPPLGEDVARTYATKDELARVEASLRGEIKSLRDAVTDTDRKAEERASGTHRRLDDVYKALVKNNRSTGMLIGIVSAKLKVTIPETED